jgi:flagellar biosynthesis protein FlhF
MAVGSFSAGLSGLNANGTYLGVIGNNLANINTIGFKSSSVTFQDLLRVVASRPDTRTHLVIAADTPVSTIGKVLERFECARPARLVLTKVDEAESLAPIVSLLRERKLPISYLGIGQHVPDDLQIATARALASWVTRDGAAHGPVA